MSSNSSAGAVTAALRRAGKGLQGRCALTISSIPRSRLRVGLSTAGRFAQRALQTEAVVQALEES